jgi:hypothetical protein
MMERLEFTFAPAGAQKPPRTTGGEPGDGELSAGVIARLRRDAFVGGGGSFGMTRAAETGRRNTVRVVAGKNLMREWLEAAGPTLRDI